MRSTSYNTENIIVKPRIQNAAKYAAGSYRKGQLLGRINATGLFTAYNPDFELDGDDNPIITGAETVRAVCPADIIIDSTVTTGPVARGEFSRDGVAAVMASLASPITLTDALIGQCWDAGIILN
ncbi:MAG: hypothetical protein LBH85_01585 [Treponema sp.]|jgi:hypothetical protein|nr:hypothetical protein [Treponema sp.]